MGSQGQQQVDRTLGLGMGLGRASHKDLGKGDDLILSVQVETVC